MNYFSSNLKYLREQKKLSQNKLAELTNVNQTTIARWETNEITPSLDNVLDVADALNVTVADLTGKDLSIDINHYDEIEKLFSKAKPHLSPDDEETIKFIMNKTIKNYEESKKKDNNS